MHHIDLETDELTPVATIFAARTGKRLNPATLWRWLRKGCHGVKLEAVPVNGVWCSTSRAFAAFFQEQTTARLTSPSESAPSPRDERTTRKLKTAGLLK